MDFTREGTGWCASCCLGEPRFSPFSVRGEPSGLTELKVQSGISDGEFSTVKGGSSTRLQSEYSLYNCLMSLVCFAQGAFFWDYSGIGVLGIYGIRVLLEAIPFSQ